MSTTQKSAFGLGSDYREKLSHATFIQEKLRQKVKIVPFKNTPKYVAGVDVSCRMMKGSLDIGICVISVFSYPELKPVEDKSLLKVLDFPYVPGFLSFREGPIILETLSRLSIEPDVIIFDGQGIAHPKGMGIATHMGVLLNKPTIGCAKNKLIGTYCEPGEERGKYSYLMHNSQVIGAVLRSRKGVKPVFVSPGHLIDIEGAVSIVMGTTKRFRIPEPIRRADQLSRALINQYTEGNVFYGKR